MLLAVLAVWWATAGLGRLGAASSILAADTRETTGEGAL
jgi:hypothetical protein